MVNKNITLKKGLTEKEFIFWEEKNGLKRSIELEVHTSRIVGLKKITTLRGRFILNNSFYIVGVLENEFSVQIYEAQNVKILF